MAKNIAYNRLKIILAEKNISQIVLAKLMKVRTETVSKWVNNEQQPYIFEMYEIARLLKVNFQLLFVATEWEDGMSEAALLQQEWDNEKKERAKNKNIAKGKRKTSK